MGRLILAVIGFVVVAAIALGIVHFVLGALGTLIQLVIFAVVALVGFRLVMGFANRRAVRRI